ncbi:tRNA glutamyl-Q synthetase [Mucilaginibacter hurinus]|uniref:tRNA glutamyl-Q synthetase n=1 Tax=Mucilaginibacter hurinus TaxID=2201324 RepID=A0A367GSJ0_9SPHI|nr:glutamate--tRNA ligase family protein [Mucilaginibacter hurinus]RCH56210.1 tRNA glutamyl-Q synthetase [Mucilaginibacter hurinus]
MAESHRQYTRTRIAPTPSGYLHLGNILSFALSASLAGKYGAKVLLRIDDLDRQRADIRYIEDIFETLNFLDIPWHEGPRDAAGHEEKYSQLHRMPYYRQALQQLAQNNCVFACTCSRTQLKSAALCLCAAKKLPLDTEGASWRLQTDNELILNIKTLTGNAPLHLPTAMQNFVVKKRDGFPAYQLTSVVDDLHYSTDLVIRGEDLWASTLAQHYLAAKLGTAAFNQIAFYHHPLLMGPGGVKLSKSAGDTSVQYLRRQGKTAGEIYSMLSGMLNLGSGVTNWQQLAIRFYNTYECDR